MQTMKFIVIWQSELSAGLRGGSDEVTISCDTDWDDERIEMYREFIAQDYDGATVLTQAEYEADCAIRQGEES